MATRRASCTWDIHRDTTARSCRAAALWSTAPAITIRRTSVLTVGCRPRTPTGWEPALPGAPLQVGRWALVWAWPSVRGAVRGGAPSATTVGDGTEHRPGDGAPMAVLPQRTSMVTGEIPPTPALARHGQIRGQAITERAVAGH